MSTAPATRINRISTAICHFFNDESGVTSIEYALIAGATGLALIAVMPTIKSNLTTTYTAVSDNLQ